MPIDGFRRVLHCTVSLSSLLLNFIFLPYILKVLVKLSKLHYKMAWEKIAEDKKARIAASIPPEWRLASAPTEDSVMDYPKKSGIMTADELAITESSATDLVAKMAEGQLTSVAVTTAFCKRAALATQLVRTIAFKQSIYCSDTPFRPTALSSSSLSLPWHVQKNSTNRSR